MKRSFRPTAAQQEIRDSDDLAMLLLAPPGCGKTEALALRAAGLIERGVIAPPRRLLLVTFTNRAKDNLAARLREHVPPAALRSRVTVCNFHGLSARIIQAHGATIGLGPDWKLPESDWVRDQCQDRDLGWDRTDLAEAHLQRAKLQALSDEEILDVLRASGADDAIEIELERHRKQQLTYGDLPRLADLILGIDSVAQLYRHHFAAVMVDEFQDLTPQQLRLVHRIGRGRTTFAGDLGQAIFLFAGASPQKVLDAINNEFSEEGHINQIVLDESHRSTPAVLDVVNAMSSSSGGVKLTCADEDAWPHAGLSATIRFSSTGDEASWVLSFTKRMLAANPSATVGVMTRIGSRRRFIDEAAADSEFDHFRWDDPTLDTQTAHIVRALFAKLELNTSADNEVSLADLRSMCGFETIQDPTVRTTTAGALSWVYDQLRQGESPDTLRKRIRVGAESGLLEQPGLHLLTAHTGKGQQFDWVILAGAEEGCIPFFKAKAAEELEEEARTMAVMLSRAKLGVIVTWSGHVEAATTGVAYSKEPSRFLRLIDAAVLYKTADELDAWLASESL